MKLAVVLFNLGGPDGPEAVEPFLTNLFSDPAVLPLPEFVRARLAKFIARRRAPVAREIYAKIGGRSPILAETEAQAAALQAALCEHDTRVFVAMRCWKPFIAETAVDVAAFAPDTIVLLPLYPQFSTTTTGSALIEWRRAATAAGITAMTATVCCFPELSGFIAAMASATRESLAKAEPGVSYRLLLSAHGLPEYVIAKGDPYQEQVERTAAALMETLGPHDWTLCYQSRVGPMQWIGPATDAEIRKCGAEGKGVVVIPVAFVSEHSETLVELDIEYAKLARDVGVKDYIRVPTVSVRGEFIEGLASLVRGVIAGAPVARQCSRFQPVCPGCMRG